MRSDQRRTRQYRYFVHTEPEPGQPAEVARLGGPIGAAFWEPLTRSWVNDPLLSVEIKQDDAWRPAEPHELPEGAAPELAVEVTPPRRRRKVRRGRHVDPAA